MNPFLRLLRLAPPVPHPRACGLYLPREGDTALVAPVDGYGGLSVERAGAVLHCPFPDAGALGRTVREALAAHVEHAKAPDLRGTKKSDWAAYQASGARSMKAFEAAYVRYSVQGTNAYNALWEVGVEVADRTELRATCPDSEKDETLGQRLLDLHALAVAIRKA